MKMRATYSNQYGKKFVSIPESKWSEIPQNLERVWCNHLFLVQQYREPTGIRLSICFTDITEEGWVEGITWEELQVIKRGVGYGDCLAVEIFPADRDIMNVANMRHLWILDEPLGWTNDNNG